MINPSSITSFDRGWFPSIDLYEDSVSFYILMEIAGVSKDDIRITIEDEQTVSISGERKSSYKENNANYCKMEIPSGRFTRDIRLPKKVDVSSIHTEYSNGMLKVILNKKLPRKVEIIEIGQ